MALKEAQKRLLEFVFDRLYFYHEFLASYEPLTFSLFFQ